MSFEVWSVESWGGIVTCKEGLLSVLFYFNLFHLCLLFLLVGGCGLFVNCCWEVVIVLKGEGALNFGVFGFWSERQVSIS